MEERFGLLFSDSSILVFPEGTSLEAAQKEAEEHDGDLGAQMPQVVRLAVTITKIFVDKP